MTLLRARTVTTGLFCIIAAVGATACSDRSLQDVLEGKPRVDKLDEPHVPTPKRVTEVDACELLTPEDIADVTGHAPEDHHDMGELCIWDVPQPGQRFSESLFVSTRSGASEGQATTLGGNSALTTREENACGVTVAVQPLQPDRMRTDELWINIQSINDAPPIEQFCTQSRVLAERGFHRLPDDPR